MLLRAEGKKIREGGGTEEGKQELMSPRTAVHVCSSSRSCAVVRIYRAKQTNSKNKWIDTPCASAEVCEGGCMCVSKCACLHTGLFPLCLCADVAVSMCVC